MDGEGTEDMMGLKMGLGLGLGLVMGLGLGLDNGAANRTGHGATHGVGHGTETGHGVIYEIMIGENILYAHLQIQSSVTQSMLEPMPMLISIFNPLQSMPIIRLIPSVMSHDQP